MSQHVRHPSLEERTAQGLDARERALPSSHAGWTPAPDRPDPVALIMEQNLRRDPDLVPVRHGRMKASPFTFYRGAAAIMAADLEPTPTAGLDVQLCGDAHLSNFGVFGSPERQLVFDINDFDETLPGPFEYDVKRLAASLTVAARNNGFTTSDARAITTASVAAYRGAMAEFSAMRTLDIWYAHVTEEDLRRTGTALLGRAVTTDKAKAKDKAKGKDKAKEAGGATAITAKEARKLEKRFDKNAAKARSRDNLQALSKLTESVNGGRRIASAPPVVVPARELLATYGLDPAVQEEIIVSQFREYRSTLQPDRRQLLERFEVVDWARKVVGVGSVGTRAFIVLLQGRGEDDPLFLQIKEATRSVLEGPSRRSGFEQAGERVVQGQRLMQATSDIFLGWQRSEEGLDGQSRDFYVRQLRDWKYSIPIENLASRGMNIYGEMCAWTLARAHARSGDRIAIAAYLGSSNVFDKAVTEFASAYADQNERDHAALLDAVESGRLTADRNL